MNAIVEQMKSEIESLTKERDAAIDKCDKLEDHIVELTSEEHSIPELRNQLQNEFEEKRKCYFTISQLQKASTNLVKERDALTLGVDQWRVDYHELRLECDALTAAAKLALDALVLLNGDAHLTMMSDEGSVGTYANKVFHKTCLSIDALHQVGVQ